MELIGSFEVTLQGDFAEEGGLGRIPAVDMVAAESGGDRQANLILEVTA